MKIILSLILFLTSIVYLFAETQSDSFLFQYSISPYDEVSALFGTDTILR